MFEANPRHTAAKPAEAPRVPRRKMSIPVYNVGVAGVATQQGIGLPHRVRRPQSAPPRAAGTVSLMSRPGPRLVNTRLQHAPRSGGAATEAPSPEPEPEPEREEAVGLGRVRPTGWSQRRRVVESESDSEDEGQGASASLPPAHGVPTLPGPSGEYLRERAPQCGVLEARGQDAPPL